jgi:K+-sensing histidine kinase KdpD
MRLMKFPVSLMAFCFWLNRHCERVLFSLLIVFLTLQDLWPNVFLGTIVCSALTLVCALAFAVRKQNRFSSENRFICTPWGIAMLCLSVLTVCYAFSYLPHGLLTVLILALIGQMLVIETKNRRFFAWVRVRRRRAQHLRWQSQRQALQTQLREGLHWISALQHDIRQPLQALGLLLSSPRIDRSPGFKSLVEQLQSCHQWIYELSENATEVAAMQANQPAEIKCSPVDLYALAASFVQWCKPLATSKGIKVSILMPAAGEVQMLTTDQKKLKRVLANLMHNALRYTDTGEVRLELTCCNKGVTFSVIDTGPGLPPHITDQINQLSPPKTSETNFRRGMGLIVVIEFCRQMGWNLRANANSDGGAKIELEIAYRSDTVRNHQSSNLILA